MLDLERDTGVKKATDILTVEDFDSVEFWVGNAYQAAYYYQHAFGFQPVAWSTLKTGNRKFASYVMQQGDAKIVLSAPYSPASEMAAHHMTHGDGVKVVGLTVRDVEVAWENALERGAKGISPPKELKDDYGSVRVATISTYGDVVHRFIERDGYDGLFLPGYQEYQPPVEVPERGVTRIDHIVGNVNWHQMDPTVQFYHNVFGFDTFIEFSENDIATQYSALRSKVVRNYNNKVKMPINEPAKGLKMSQIEEYINYYHGAGVQHIALSTDDIVSTVKSMRERGVEFIRVPHTYYDNLIDRVGEIEEDVEVLAEHGILVDRDDKGYLLQLFTRPIQDRPTFFFEIIQRKGSEGFGKGNFQALFEAIEREQAERGNL
ncbi:MAG: 4-hydroxyphenylpyruvate dioxygenase [Methanobacteriota archaeon]|nr:MAG: 4-hydroxyphenylpyruvate dioxygenase [Euryarchaeota archaeon]